MPFALGRTQRAASSNTSRAAWALLSGAWLAVACAGRATTIEGAGGIDAGGVAGSSHGGTSSSGGPNNGSAAGGGGFACPVDSCPKSFCGPGLVETYLPGLCCPTCQPLCDNRCPYLNCAEGYHLATPDGECCPMCVGAAVDTACAAGRNKYQVMRASVVQESQSLPCAVASDCTVISLLNRCDTECLSVSVLSSQGTPIDSALREASEMLCASCPPAGVYCPPSPVISCVDGRCSDYVPIPPP